VTEDAVRRWGEDLLPLRAVLGPRVDPERAERLAAAAQDRRNVRILRAPADFPVLLATAEIVVCTSSVTPTRRWPCEDD
jgi:predicted glycosyltransferase